MEETAPTGHAARRSDIHSMALLLAGIAAVVALALLAPESYRAPVILGVVQGLSEFLPISSSAHLIVVPRLLGWQDQGLTFDVALHVGTLLAVLGYFWRDWLRLLRAAPYPSTSDGRLFWFIVLATIPAGLVGLALEDIVEEQLRSLLLIAGTLTVVGVLLWLVDRARPQSKDLGHITLRGALLVGVAQALALIPGVSRSGITILAGRAQGLTREAAARFSFLLSTPLIAAAGLLKLQDLSASDLTGPFLAGVLAAAIVGALAIGLLLRYLRSEGFGLFAIYRVLLALVLIAFVLAG